LGDAFDAKEKKNYNNSKTKNNNTKQLPQHKENYYNKLLQHYYSLGRFSHAGLGFGFRV
jgi:hypothetical protein